MTQGRFPVIILRTGAAGRGAGRLVYCATDGTAVSTASIEIIIILFIVVQFYWFDDAKIPQRPLLTKSAPLQSHSLFPKLQGRFPIVTLSCDS